MRTYLEKNDEKFVIQLNNFATKIEAYAVVFGFSADEISAVRNDAAFSTWAVFNVKKISTHKKHWVAFKTLLLSNPDGKSNNPPPVPPELEVMPIPVAPGIVRRFTVMVNRIKAHQNYTEGIGQNLGIIYTPSYHNDDSTRPVLKAILRAGRVNLDWKKGHFDAIMIEKSAGNGFIFLDKSLRNTYVDLSPMPPEGESALWQYRAMYLKGDTLVGQWSDIITVTASG